jgi:hypothetical protein
VSGGMRVGATKEALDMTMEACARHATKTHVQDPWEQIFERC